VSILPVTVCFKPSLVASSPANRRRKSPDIHKTRLQFINNLNFTLNKRNDNLNFQGPISSNYTAPKNPVPAV
jgi:hypothetical protein